MSKETMAPSHEKEALASDAKVRDSGLNHENAMPVIGIGASAGGLESIERFFENIDVTTGAAFVIIQHLSPDFKSFMPEILLKRTTLQVLTAAENMVVQPNVIYLMPPRKNLTIEDGVLYLTDIERSRIPNKPIDLFFESLAHDVGDRAVAVVLSGTGTDGAEGVRKVSAAGGRVFVESPASAKFDGMPVAALAMRVHEGEGTPFELAGDIFGKDIQDLNSPTQALKRQLAGDDERLRIFKAVESRHGVDFSRYKIATVNRRIDRRMTELNLANIGAYANFVQDNDDEISTLYYEMLIGVTKFFRDPEAFELLKEDIKRIVEEKRQGEEVRVWSAGCASGEETYSLTMLFTEEIKRSGKSLHLKVFATDIDDEILGRASAGYYRREQMTDVPKNLITRYFKEKSDRYKVSAGLRSRVVFARHNIMNDPPFAKLDMIACRNLLIYLNSNTQRQVLSLFYFSLNPRGTLFLGPSESLGKYEAGYDTIDSKWKIFSKSDHSLPAVSNFEPLRPKDREFPVVVGAAPRSESFARSTQMKINADGAYQALLEQYVPAGLLVDGAQDLIHVYGEPPFTLAFKPGKVSNNLRSFLDENLCTAISVFLQRARQERSAVECSEFTLVENGEERAISFKVTPVIPQKKDEISYYLITFSEEAQYESAKSEAETRIVVEKSVSLDQVSVLEEELKNAKQHLQATIEELETTNEELQSTNEELLASNEELQSTNEELHSVNEELYTVNSEYQTKITELNQLSMDEEHLFRSTGVGTIFIDHERRIRKFTPTAAELFNLLNQDHGRPFDHVTHLFEGVNFNNLVEQCIRTQDTIEIEVNSRANEPHLVKIVPYKDDRDEPDGVVISFVSTQAVKHAEQLYKDMFQSSPVGIVGLTTHQDIESMNPSICHLLGISDDELLGKPMEALFPESQATAALNVVSSFVSGDGTPTEVEQVASAVLRKDGTELPVEISVNSVPTATGTLIHLYVTDMTQRQQYVDTVESHRDQLEELVAERTVELERRTEEYEDLYENAPEMYASFGALNLAIEKCNNRLASMTGVDKSELIGMHWRDLYHPDSHTELKSVMELFMKTGSIKARPIQLVSKSGERIPVLLSIDAVRDEKGSIVQGRSTLVDVSDVHALKRENRTFLLATQGSEIGIWDWDFDSGEQVWSEKFHELLGYPDGTSHQLSFNKSDIVHPDDKVELTELFRQHFAQQKDFDIEVRLRTYEGDYRWFRLQGKATRSDSGKATRMVGSAQDTHRAREAQDELKAQAEIHAFITQETNDGWWDWHTQTDYEYMSPRFWQTFGYDPETKKHSPSEWQSLIHPEDLQVTMDNFSRHNSTRGEYPYLQEVRYKHNDGHWVTVLRRGRIIEWDKTGEPVRMIGVHTDVSKIKDQDAQLKEINAQLAKSNEDLEQFAYITSHDLKAPLRGITTLVGFMEEDLEGLLDQESEAARGISNNLRRLARQAERMEGLISGVLDYSRVDSAGASLEDVDVRELLLDIAIDHSLEVGGGLILPCELPMLRTDPIMFEQVLGNLISNAVKFHPNREEVRIEIDCAREADIYTFSVADNGPGINPDFHARIFEMFQTLHSKDTYESTGIGLTLVKRIVEKFGGEIFVDSDEGKGARFMFSWPAKTDDPVM